MDDHPRHGRANRHSPMAEAVSKVPEVTLGFWIVKIAATTLGETGGDWVTMSLNLGYLIGCAIFTVIFVALVAAQVKAKHFHAVLYWATIVGTTTLGTTIADFADRTVGPWLSRRCRPRGRPARREPRYLVLVGTYRFGREHHNPQSGMVLLGHNPVLTNTRHRAGRLVGGQGPGRSRVWLR